MDIGEVEDGDAQHDEVRTRRRHQRRKGGTKASISPISTKTEKREFDSRQDSLTGQKTKKQSLVCYSCGGKRHPARLCSSSPDHAAQAVSEKRRNCCGVIG